MTGLEAALGTAAKSGASRIFPPLYAKAVRRRKANQAIRMADLPPSDRLPSLSPAEAEGVTQYIKSRDFEVLATQIALSQFLAIQGRTTGIAPFDVESSMRVGIRAKTRIEGDRLRILVDTLRRRLTSEITTDLHDLDIDKLPSGILAQLLTDSADQAAAATRNSELLSKITDLSSIHKFELDLRNQIAALQAKMRMPSAGILKSVSYSQLYVEPILSLKSSSQADAHAISATELVQQFNRAVIVGDPGGGKSTLAAKIIHDVASRGESIAPTASVPFLLILREYISKFQSDRTAFIEYLADLCRFPYQVEPPAHAIEYILSSGRALVVFDGLDELTDTSLRRQVVEAIEGFTHRYPNVSIVVTSRRIGYDEAPLDSSLFPHAELQEFSESQVSEYVAKWFAIDQHQAESSCDRLTTAFMRDSQLVHDLRTNPLMLSLMCGMYSVEGYIPANRPDVYEKCALLLFERWDRQRGIITPLPFNSHVRYAIQAMAWWLYTEPNNQARLTRPRLLQFMTNYLNKERFADRADAENAAESFIEFCTGRAWVLNKVGSSEDVEHFAFTHQTFLEYFAAFQMVRKFPDPTRLYAELDPYLRRAEWEVVAQLALQIVNRNVESGANSFLELLLEAATQSSLKERSNLLAFAARMLEFIVPNPTILKAIVSAIVQLFTVMPDSSGNPLSRRYHALHDLYIYDAPILQLKKCGTEVHKDVASTVAESVIVALQTMPADYNALILCEESKVILGDLVSEPSVMGSWARVKEMYETATSSQPFVWRDVNRAIKGSLPIRELVRAHGAQALYDAFTVSETASTYTVHAGVFGYLKSSIESKAESKNKADPAAIAEQIVSVLLETDWPWVDSPGEIFANVYYAPSNWADATRGYHFAALLMLSLPDLEEFDERASAATKQYLDGTPNILQMCERARAGKYSKEVALTELIQQGEPPPEVVRFLRSWLAGTITLMRPSSVSTSRKAKRKVVSRRS
jgi:hypothetical protein